MTKIKTLEQLAAKQVVFNAVIGKTTNLTTLPTFIKKKIVRQRDEILTEIDQFKKNLKSKFYSLYVLLNNRQLSTSTWLACYSSLCIPCPNSLSIPEVFNEALTDIWNNSKSYKKDYMDSSLFLAKIILKKMTKEESLCQLIFSVKHGFNGLVSHLLKRHCDINYKMFLFDFSGSRYSGYNHMGAIHYAADRGNLIGMEFLLKNEADVHLEDDHKQTALHLAADVNIARLLLKKGAQIDVADQYHLTPLLRAAENGRADVMRLLLQKGANVYAKDYAKNTALHHVAASPYYAGKELMEAAQLLIEHQLLLQEVTINFRNRDGDTPLHIAVKNENNDLIKLFLQFGADVNIKNKEGNTPLHCALTQRDEWRQEKSTALLLKYGTKPNVNLQNAQGNTALHLAATSSSPTVGRDLVTLLALYGAKPKIYNDSSRLPKDYAYSAQVKHELKRAAQTASNKKRFRPI